MPGVYVPQSRHSTLLGHWSFEGLLIFVELSYRVVDRLSYAISELRYVP